MMLLLCITVLNTAGVSLGDPGGNKIMTDVRYGRYASDDINSFYLEAARGRIDGVTVVHKFGLAQNINTADGESDIWDGMSADLGSNITPYNWIDSGPVDLQISSSSASDVGNEMSGEGLDEDWNLSSGSVILNGQTAVPIGFQRNRIHRAFNSGPTELVGIVYVSDLGTSLTAGVPDDPSKIRAIVHPEAQQTEMALYTVPVGHKLFITQGWANVARENVPSGQAGVKIYRRTFGGVFRKVHTLSLSVAGSSGDQRPYQLPIVFNGKEDLIYKASVSTNGMAVSAGFHGLLIKD